MVKILQHHTVVRDGWHNMLTDLAYWRDYYWLAYRRVSGHFEVDGKIIVMRSVDLKRWHEVAQLKTAGNDWCPRFCLADNRLFVYFSTSYPIIDQSFRRFLQNTQIRFNPGTPETVDLGVSHVSFTDDGIHWSKSTPAWKNRWMYGVRYHDGTFYSAAWGTSGDPRDHAHGPVDLLTSQDGLNWKKLSTIAGVRSGFDESDLFFHPDGEVWVIASAYAGRGAKARVLNAGFFSSKPPYLEWEYVDLKTRVSAPCFCESGGKLYVAVRRYLDDPWIPQSTPAGNTAIFTVEKGKIEPLFALPSCGDMWQPALISREPGKLIISYNSQHAYLSGVIPGKMPIPPSGARPDIYVGDDDIYIAEIAVE